VGVRRAATLRPGVAAAVVAVPVAHHALAGELQEGRVVGEEAAVQRLLGGARRVQVAEPLADGDDDLEDLNPSVRCGLSRNAFQIRPTVDLDSPDRRAIDARDQCVASGGVSSSVATITASTWASVIVRGAPGRGSSTSPSSRRATNRDRHLPTVGSDTPSSAATWVLVAPRSRTPERSGTATPAPGRSWPAATSGSVSGARPRSSATALSAVLSSPSADTTTLKQRISGAGH